MIMLINGLGILLIAFVVYWFWWPGKTRNKKKSN